MLRVARGVTLSTSDGPQPRFPATVVPLANVDECALAAGSFLCPLVSNLSGCESDAHAPVACSLAIPLSRPSFVTMPAAGRVVELSQNSRFVIVHLVDANLWVRVQCADIRALKVGQLLDAGARLTARTVSDVRVAVARQLLTRWCAADVAAPDLWLAARECFLDPIVLLGAEPSAVFDRSVALAQRRSLSMLDNQTLTHESAGDGPLAVLCARNCLLIDETGRASVDCRNNVAAVGHCNEIVVRAMAEQALRLNTNTRFLNRIQADFAADLLETLPASFRGGDQTPKVILVNSGTEANELALRIATNDGRKHFFVLKDSYFGNSSTLVQLSDYKFAGRQKQVDVTVVGDEVPSSIPRESVFMFESILGCGGMRFPPSELLVQLADKVHAGGGVVICDEVQTLGRCETMFAFELHPGLASRIDMISIGKPLANGFPCAALILRDAASKFAARFAASAIEFFSTFGGSHAMVAAASATLKLILRERQTSLSEKCRFVWQLLRERVAVAKQVRDIRGSGLFIGIEVETASLARSVEQYCLFEKFFLISREDAVLVIKPPLTISLDQLRTLVDSLAEAIEFCSHHTDSIET